MPKIAAVALLALAASSLPAAAERLPLGGSSELRCTQKGAIGLVVTSDRPITFFFFIV